MYNALKILLALMFLFSQSARADITTGLLDWWKFDNGSGTSATDSGSDGKTGTLLMGVNFPTWVTGKIGPYATDYNSGYTDVGVLNTIGLSAMTVSAWVNSPADTGDYQNVIGTFDGANGWLIHIKQASGICILILVGNGGSFLYSGTNVLGGWHHIAMVFDGSLTGDTNRLKLYVDGVQITSLTNGGGGIPSTVPNTTTQTIEMGRLSSGTIRYLIGSLDDVRVYNRALTAADITDLYNYTGAVASRTNVITVKGGLTAKGKLTVSGV